MLAWDKPWSCISLLAVSSALTIRTGGNGLALLGALRPVALHAGLAAVYAPIPTTPVAQELRKRSQATFSAAESATQIIISGHHLSWLGCYPNTSAPRSLILEDLPSLTRRRRGMLLYADTAHTTLSLRISTST